MKIGRSARVYHAWHGYVGIAVFVVLVLIGITVIWKFSTDARAGVDASKYQIIELTTGESYIGKLSHLQGAYVDLTNVYYQQTQPSSSQQVTVLKLSDSVAKPENAMRIARDKIVHWENLSADSKIVEVINSDQKQ